ncbi:MAG: hypothetical protein ACK8QZ_02380 [Anaerolineales bacterium]
MRYYLAALRHSESPARILAQAGIEIHAAAFWQGGFDVLAELLEQLEQLPVTSGH